MRRAAVGLVLFTVALLSAWPARGQVIVPTNAGFTTPALSNGTHVQRPTGASWTFTSKAGVAHNDPSHTDTGLTNSPTGQAAYLQQRGTVQQSVGGFANTNYTLTFLAEGSSTLGVNHIQVKVDSTVLTFGGASSILPTNTSSFASFTSDTFHLSAGSHTLQFLGLDNSGAPASFVVNPMFNPVATPEPSSFALCLVLASGGFVYYRRRRAKQVAQSLGSDGAKKAGNREQRNDENV